MNDQKAKGDKGKPKLSLVPRRIIFDIAAIREYGNNKYPEGGVDNWKKVEPERYRDAAFRHFLAYLDDPYGVDEESGLPHLWHLACNIAFLCDLEDSFMSPNKKSEIIHVPYSSINDDVGWFNWVASSVLSDISKEWEKERDEQGRSN